jgi:diguanylate cyclase (GGDEF)-like protein
MWIAMLSSHKAREWRSTLSLTLLLCLLALTLPANGALWPVGDDTGPVDEHLSWLSETDSHLGMEQVMARLHAGHFTPASRQMLSFGIGADPVWVHLPVDNPGEQPAPRTVMVGATWVDRIDFHVVHDGRLVSHRVAGDLSPDWQRPLPGLGSVFQHDFHPGRSDIFVRAENPDPLMLPIRFMTPEAAADLQERSHYTYGLVYGFLLALLLYNFTLYLGLRRPSHRNYSIYLGIFLLMNMAYTGHGYAWLWPGQIALQQYIILVLMVLFAVAGLAFAYVFLDLPRHAPRLARLVRVSSVVFIMIMLITVSLQEQTLAALWSFTVALVFSIALFALGCMAVANGYTAAKYFVTAAASGILGTGATTLTVWGWIPYTEIGFRAVEVGLLLEATLLALALVYLVRENDRARRRAERLARIDALTGLLNRRALMEQGEGLWNIARRTGQPLSLILLDLDHFKRINDAHGHAVGDRALMEAATMIDENCRSGDLAARWGGEEFLIMLPGAGHEQAEAFVTRLQKKFARRVIETGGAGIRLRASFGLAVMDWHETLDNLIREADDWLYRAKEAGRDQVCSARLCGTVPA